MSALFSFMVTKEDIKTFLRNQRGFLICQAELFCGMEAKSVVYCLDEDFDVDPIRVNLMRACSQLNIVYSYSKNHLNRTEFPKANLGPTFINGCKRRNKDYVFQCKTCEEIAKELGRDENEKGEIWICKPCSLSCHHYHKKEWKAVRHLDRKIVRCKCRTKHPICLFKNAK